MVRCDGRAMPPGTTVGNGSVHRKYRTSDGTDGAPGSMGCALDACGRMGAEPSEALYLGDTSVDMRTARAAGIMALGASWGFRGEAELRAAGADAILEQPPDLLEYP